ncbi:GNAT family N-acetyltransferase [Chromobacterium sp. IIBBL 290-4]|uniref:GNAT family N-acetyltransferase n=1 Tax=Chromobacterium sp. IIBBL 290-4 TaxID=2953890 RepID=UPI0020B88E17|nr:GNAT family N-acetyltransferase [Chromobacterium sp. IIBBL 290-4]UTH75715.1 GNAT family N-acetyltransferase [Chromobacterium sp. IIBBL 290-4]
MSDAVSIRPPLAGELALLAQIERRAAALFSPDDLPAALSGQTLPEALLREAAAAGLLWVAERNGQAAGFALAEMLDGQLHLAEMDVDPAHARRGIGAALLAKVAAHGAAAGFAAVTLTTFAHLPWNAPFYRRHGFEPYVPTTASQLEQRLKSEALAGLRQRIAMRRVLRSL